MFIQHLTLLGKYLEVYAKRMTAKSLQDLTVVKKNTVRLISSHPNDTYPYNVRGNNDNFSIDMNGDIGTQTAIISKGQLSFSSINPCDLY